MIDLEDTSSAFAYKNNWELRKALYLFSFLKYPSIVKLGSKLLRLSLSLKIPIKPIIRKTIFNQFCGGENIYDCNKRITQLAKYNVGTILDYSVEGQENIDDFEHNKKEIINTILMAKNNDNIPFSVFKVTGLGRCSLIEKASKKKKELNEKEKKEIDELILRIDQICKIAFENYVSVFIDAEDSFYQDFIDYVAELMIKRYNKKSAIVYNTIQLYRHDKIDYLKRLINYCKQENLYLGVKLVRGAYMEKERELAYQKGYKDPIHATKKDTDFDYNQALKFCIDNIDHVSICAGSHNENSTKTLIKLMSEKNLLNNDNRVYFAQLLGMSDHISFNLSKNGYNVAKYVPYGPINKLLPYLIRRAEENTSVSGQTGRELTLLKIELDRRSI